MMVRPTVVVGGIVLLAAAAIVVAFARLEGEIARLRGQVAAAEKQSAGTGASKGTGHPVPPVRKPQEQTATFERYFASLDQVRREAADPALTARYVRALRAVDPAFSALKEAHLDGVTCGDGLCRVDLTFPSSAQVDQGKTELMFQIGPLSSSASIYSDLKRPHVAGYFAAPGHRLPPFPDAPK